MKTQLQDGAEISLPPEIILSVTESQITLRCLSGRNTFFAGGEIQIPLSGQRVVFRLDAQEG